MAIDEKQLRACGIYEAKLPLAALLQDFKQIGNALTKTEAHRRALRNLSKYSILAAVVLMVAGALGVVYVLPAGALLLPAGVFCFVRSFYYGGKLLNNKARFELADSLIALLREDAAAEAQYSVRLMFAPQPALLKEADWPQRKKGKQRFYAENWLAIGGRLLDGTEINEEVTELLRKRTFVNPRGKHKTKTRSRYMLALQFAYPSKAYGDACAAWESMAEEPRIPPSARMRSVRVTDKAIALKALVNDKNEIAQSSAMLWLAAYRILNLARRTRDTKK